MYRKSTTVLLVQRPVDKVINNATCLNARVFRNPPRFLRFFFLVAFRSANASNDVLKINGCRDVVFDLSKSSRRASGLRGLRANAYMCCLRVNRTLFGSIAYHRYKSSGVL